MLHDRVGGWNIIGDYKSIGLKHTELATDTYLDQSYFYQKLSPPNSPAHFAPDLTSRALAPLADESAIIMLDREGRHNYPFPSYWSDRKDE